MTMKRESPGPSASEPQKKKTLAIDPWGRPRFKGCVTIKNYEQLGKLGEGTFGEVHKARHRVKGNLVALKKILMHNAKEEGFPITALREIKILKSLSHPNIIRLLEMAVERKSEERVISPRGTMYMITPYMEHDLAGLLENKDVDFNDSLIKCYLLQLLEGTKYLHEKQILHRDMKAANLLIDNRGVLRIADFGLARIYAEPPPVAGQGGGTAKREYTNCVVTRWYRPPELLLGEKKYTTAIDLWGVGCVFAEMYKRKPILQGNSDMDQIVRIFQLCGSPNQKNMPGYDRLPGYDAIKNMTFQRTLESQHSRTGSAGVALLSELLRLDPVKRINAMDAMKHEYFRVDPQPLKPGEVPKFNDSHELDGKKNRHRGLPPAPAGGSVGVGQNGPEWASRAGEMPWGGNNAGGGSRRPPGDWQNGAGGAGGTGAGGGSGRRPFERAPPTEGRIPPVHRGQGDHRPPWAKSASAELPPARDAGLPPRPGGPPDRDRRDRDRDRDRDPPRRNNRAGVTGVGGQDMDTYIPSYGAGGPGGDSRRPERSWDRERERDRPAPDRGNSRGASREVDRRERGYSGGTHRSVSRDRDNRDMYRR